MEGKIVTKHILELWKKYLKMPTNFTSIVHANIPILSCQPDPHRASNLFQTIQSQLWVEEYCDTSDITTMILPIEVHMYFSDSNDIPDDDSLVSIEGMFIIPIRKNV